MANEYTYSILRQEQATSYWYLETSNDPDELKKSKQHMFTEVYNALNFLKVWEPVTMIPDTGFGSGLLVRKLISQPNNER